MAKKLTKKEISDVKRSEMKKQLISLEHKMKKIPYYCNQCGKSCQIDHNVSSDNYGLINAKVYGGYYSNKLEDGVGYTFSLCEPCLSEMFSKFKIKPDKEEY